MKHKPLSASLLPLALALATATVAVAQAQPDPEILSAWKLNSENLVVVFRHDGSYFLVDANEENPGMERGTFEWDKASGTFSANTIVDTNGDAGLSHPNGATSISISGNTLNYTVADEGTFSFDRIVNTSSPIVGSWIIPGEKFSITFLSDGSYYLSEEANDVPFGHTGIEKGTYTWNATTNAFTATAAIDTNGDVGTNGVPPGVTVTITGNSLVFFDGEESTTLLRLTTHPTPIPLPDFGVARFANHLQTSDSTPAPRAFDEANEIHPYSADAFVDPAVGATAPTVQIGTGAPITLTLDDPGSFEIEWGLPDSSTLNSLLPASTAIQFKDGTDIADLTTAAAPTFPTTPKILVRDGASWSGTVYQFGDDEVLQWTLPSGFTASQFLTEIEVYDPDADEDVVNVLLQGDVTHFDLGGKLDPDKQYIVELEFYRIDNSTTSGNGLFAGKQGYVLSASSTTFSVESLPDVSQEPLIFVQPESQAGTQGSPVLLQVGINEEAFATSTFQWFKDDVEIPGQTGNSLFIPSYDSAEDSGYYRVAVANDMGYTESTSAFVGSAVQYLFIHNGKVSRQQSATTTSEAGATFDARVEGLGITATFPASSISVRKPDNTLLPLALDEDHWDVETDFPGFNAMRTSFPAGTYGIEIEADTISIQLTGTAFPNQPLVSASIGTWVDGKLRLTASQAASAFTLTTNSNTGSGWSRILVTDPTDEDIVDVIANVPWNSDPFAVAEISGGLLSVGQSYEVEARFDNTIERVDVSDKSWASKPPSPAKGYELLSTTTLLTIEVVPDPASESHSTWQAGFFSPAQLADPAISGDNVDFDNDGLANLLEYLFGGNPTLPSSGLLPSVTKAPDGNNLVFTYKRKVSATGVTQVIEHATSLSPPWTPAVHGQNGVTIATAASPRDPTSEQVTVTIPSTSANRFVRLRATR